MCFLASCFHPVTSTRTPDRPDNSFPEGGVHLSDIKCSSIGNYTLGILHPCGSSEQLQEEFTGSVWMSDHLSVSILYIVCDVEDMWQIQRMKCVGTLRSVVYHLNGISLVYVGHSQLGQRPLKYQIAYCQSASFGYQKWKTVRGQTI